MCKLWPGHTVIRKKKSLVKKITLEYKHELSVLWIRVQAKNRTWSGVLCGVSIKGIFGLAFSLRYEKYVLLYQGVFGKWNCVSS